MSWAITSLASLIGIENPIPCPDATIAVLIPITRPSRLSSGPPELPGLIDASVWMKFSYVVTPTRLRAVADTMPTVTVRSRPNGLPIAIDPLPDPQPIGVAQLAPPAAAPAHRPSGPRGRSWDRVRPAWP